MEAIKDIRFIIRIKNNRLVRHREKLGLSQAKMAELCGVSQTEYGRIENLQEFPVKTKTGDWKEVAQRISSVIGLPEEELFPEAFKKISKTRWEKEIGLPQLAGMSMPRLGPVESVEAKEREEEIKKQLLTLTPREQTIIIKRFGLFGNGFETREEISKGFNLTLERIKQIEEKALRKLRYPTRARKLRRHINF
jgi:RNA polymerase sigma factor (sigma-70 family)